MSMLSGRVGLEGVGLGWRSGRESGKKGAGRREGFGWLVCRGLNDDGDGDLLCGDRGEEAQRDRWKI